MDRRGDDINVHASIEDAQLHLESIDVKNNEYTAYDFEGRLLALNVVSDKTPVLFGILQTRVERVRIQEAEEEPFHADELRSALVRFLTKVNLVDHSLELENTAKLVERVAEVIASNTRKEV